MAWYDQDAFPSHPLLEYPARGLHNAFRWWAVAMLDLAYGGAACSPCAYLL